MTRKTLFHRPPGIWSRLAMMGLAGLVSTLTAPPHISQAQVPPITPSGLNTQISGPITVPGGTQYTITGGTRPGAGPNLFHSFGEFGVPTTNIANFLNNSGAATSNILGRVTGGNPSNIFGTIQTTGFGSANLYLMNPAGILFGPQATLHIGGMATFTTADSLRLADGTVFHAAPNAEADALLSVAPVATFGFLGPRAGPITVDHSTLQMPEGKGLALVGGAISIVGGRLVAKGAPIELTARESIVMSGVGPERPTGVLTSADSAGHPGHVTLSAPTIRLQTTTVESTAGKIGSAGTITIQGFGGGAAQTVSLENALVRTTISGGSAASTPGTITFTADTVTLANGTHITADSSGAAPAGNITFNVGSLTMKGGPNRIHIVPEDLESNPIFSRTGVLVESTSSSLDAGAGKAGQVTIQGINGPGTAATSVTLEDSTINTRVFGGTAATPPALISITADAVALSNHSTIFATTNGPAPGGNIEFHVNTLRSNMNSDGTMIEGGVVFIGGPSESPERTAGPAGAVTISGPRVGSTDPATLIALSNTHIDTFVNGGSATTMPAPISITADSVSLNNSTIFVTTASGEAPAGNINLNVGTLRANVNPDGTPIKGVDGVFLQTPSHPGQAGSVTISGPGPESTDPAKLVALDKTQISTAILGGTATTPAPTITITAETLALTAERGTPGFDEAIGETGIFATSQGAAPAGNLAFNVGTLRTNVNPDGTPIEHGHVFFASSGNGSGPTAGPAGTVTISGLGPESTDAASLVMLRNAEINTSVAGGTGVSPPGAITVTADSVALPIRADRPWPTFGLTRASSSGDAPAGNIAFNAGTFSAENAIITSSSTSSAVNAGHAGSVTIQGVGGVGSRAAGITLNQTSITTEANAGAGGSIALASASGINLAGSTISATVSGGNQPGGNITLSAGHHIALTAGSVLSAQGTGLGDAGNIVIDAGQSYISANSKVTTEAAQASGGNITVTAPGVIQLTDSQINSSVQGSTTTIGGNITIDPQFVILQNSQILAQATQGQGGNIAITTNVLVPDATSLVDASSQFGVSGTVRIQSPNAPAAGKIVPLSQSPLPATALLGVRCAALEGGQYSTFVVAGHYGVPTEPGGWLASPLAAPSAEAGRVARGEWREDRSTVSSLTNEPEILSLRRLPSSNTMANIFLTNWTADCGS